MIIRCKNTNKSADPQINFINLSADPEILLAEISADPEILLAEISADPEISAIYAKNQRNPILATPFFTQPVLHPFVERCRVIPKEVEIHYDRDFENQIGFERGLFEDFVDMVARAANLTRQPACATQVGFELRLDKMPDVDVALKVFHLLT